MRDGPVDQVIITICSDSIGMFSELRAEAPLESIPFLLIRVGVVSSVLAYIVESLSILQYHVGPLRQCQELIQLVVHDASRDMMSPKGCLELIPSHHMVSWKHSEVVIPLGPCGYTELLGGKTSLGGIRASSCEKEKLELHNPEPHNSIQWILNLGK